MDAKLEGKLSQYSDLSWLNTKRYLCQFSQIEFVMIQIMQCGQQTRMKKKNNKHLFSHKNREHFSNSQQQQIEIESNNSFDK